MTIYYITVLVHGNYRDTISYYFDSKEIAEKYIENIISTIQKNYKIDVQRYPEENIIHFKNEHEFNHAYKINELNKFFD